MCNLPLEKSRKEFLAQRSKNYIDITTDANGKDSENPVLIYLEEVLNTSEEVSISLELYDIVINGDTLPVDKFDTSDIIRAQKILDETFSNSNFALHVTINYNVLLTSKYSQGGYKTLTIIKKRSITIDSILEKGVGNEEIISWLVHAIKNDANMAILGENSKQQQAILSALIAQSTENVARDKRFIAIGGSVEMNLKNSLILSPVSGEMKFLINSALRMRPDAIIVGEIASQANEKIIILDEDNSTTSSLGDINEDVFPIFIGMHGHQLLSTMSASSLKQIDVFSNIRAKNYFCSATDFVVEISEQQNGHPYISAVKQPVFESNNIVYRTIWETRLDKQGNIVWYKNEVPTRAVRRRLNLDNYIVLDTIPEKQELMEDSQTDNNLIDSRTSPQLSLIRPEEAQEVLEALNTLTSFFQKFITK
jgi:hypothetical protein